MGTALRGGLEATRTCFFPEGAQIDRVCSQTPATAGGSHQEAADHGVLTGTGAELEMLLQSR